MSDPEVTCPVCQTTYTKNDAPEGFERVSAFLAHRQFKYLNKSDPPICLHALGQPLANALHAEGLAAVASECATAERLDSLCVEIDNALRYLDDQDPGTARTALLEGLRKCNPAWLD